MNLYFFSLTYFSTTKCGLCAYHPEMILNSDYKMPQMKGAFTVGEKKYLLDICRARAHCAKGI